MFISGWFFFPSVEDLLQNEFRISISDENVHLIDPFTGTGTFITRLLQSNLIRNDSLLHKYKNELHANEIVLLAYYIAAVDIEETFHGLLDEQDPKTSSYSEKKRVARYHPFQGIVLTDTFQLAEPHDGQQDVDEQFFPSNNERVSRQKAAPIRVVMSNPPYSVSGNPVPYPALDSRIEATYAARSTATNKKPFTIPTSAPFAGLPTGSEIRESSPSLPTVPSPIPTSATVFDHASPTNSPRSISSISAEIREHRANFPDRKAAKSSIKVPALRLQFPFSSKTRRNQLRPKSSITTSGIISLETKNSKSSGH